MEEYAYLIIGGGMTAAAAVQGIREIDLSGRIGIFSQEEYPPYRRPPLTKDLWFGKDIEDIWCNTGKENTTMHLNTAIKAIDPVLHTVTDSNDHQYRYQKLLLATGGIPKQLSGPNSGVLYFRTLRDYYALRALYETKENFVIIGGGFIGTELAAALAMNGKRVTLIFQDPTIGAKILPKGFSSFLSAYFTEKGIQLIPQQTVLSVEKHQEKWLVKTSGKNEVYADGVIAGLGISPNTDLASSIQLEIDNGIVVNAQLQTSMPDIWAAGDVANFYSLHLEKRVRIEHDNAATSMGKIAGKNMAGAGEPYQELPFFYSDLFELSYEAIGELSSDMEIVEDWLEPYRLGAIYYLKDKKLRGAMLWGIWGQIPKIRKMILAKETFSVETLNQTIH